MNGSLTARARAVIMALACAGLAGCGTTGGTLVMHKSGLSRAERDLLPKASEDASEVMLLQANVNCQFFVDGQPLAKGRRVRILVTKAAHQVVCKPDGYRAKEEYLQPPFDPNYPIGFTFLLEDKLAQAEPARGATAKAEPADGMPAGFEAKSDVDDPPKTKAKPRKNAYAVLVGIEKYRDLPKVDYAARDAETVKRYLVEAMGYAEENVILTTNERATRSDIQAYFETWLANNVQEPTDEVFVYFAGHGSPEPKSGDAYLVPYDGNPSFLQTSAYPLKRFYESLGKLPTKNIVVVMDACFSGAGGRSVIAKGTRPLVAKADSPIIASDGTVVLAAASGEQVSSFYEEKRHGLLTYFFLKGLHGAADANGDKTVDMVELYEFVKPNVVKTARRLNNVDQTPQLMPPPGALSERRLGLVELAR